MSDHPSPESGDRATAEILQRLQSHRTGQPRYRVSGEVGRGGMGAILQVWDEDLRRPLAMKVVLGDSIGAPAAPTTSAGDTTAAWPTPISVEPRRMARFLEEAQITGQLEHPGIVPVHELGLDEQGNAYFTMRLVRGRNLESIFELVEHESEGWSLTRALGVMLRVCEAMAFAHDRKVLHRDLKPANVMVGQFGEVYVMDWGLARVQGDKDLHDVRLRAPQQPAERVATDRRERFEDSDPNLYTMDGDVVGTPAYMSPEQARGDLEAIDARSDVYAVGAMLYRLLGGTAPYCPDGPRPAVKVLFDLLEGPPAPLAPRSLAAPPELVAITGKAMARDRDDRYPTMLALAEDLRAFLENRVVRAYETGAWAEARKWIGRNRALAGALAAAVLLLVGGLVASLLLKAEADRQTGLAETRRREAEQQTSLAETRRVEAETSAARAEREAAVAKAVSDFLNDDMLAAVAPEHMGTNVLVRDVLSVAADSLDVRFGTEPEVESALRMTIGRSFERLGEPDRARTQFERALELREGNLGDAAEETLQARLALASASASLGDGATAEASYRQVLATTRQAFGTEHRAYLTATSDLAMLLEGAGRGDEARVLYEQNLVVERRVLGPAHDDTVTTENNLGVLLTGAGQYDEAESLLVGALTARQRTLGARHPLTLDTQSNLALLRMAQGRYQESEQLFERSLTARIESFGADHVVCARSLGNLAQVRMEQGRVAEALPDFERAFATLQAKLGPEHAWTLVAAGNLAAALADAGQLERALPLREQTLAAQRRTLGEEHPDTLLSMGNLASLYNTMARPDAAEQLGRETLAIEQRVLGDDHPTTLTTRENLSGALFRRGDHAEAEQLLQQVLDGRKRALGAQHPAVTRTIYNLAMIRKSTKQSAEAEELFREALRRNRADLPAGHAAIGDCLANLASLRSEAMDYADAEACYREALAIRQQTLGPDAPETTVLMHDLGFLFYKRGDAEAAIAELQAALEIRRRVHGDDHVNTQTTAFVLGFVSLKAGHHAEAEPLLLAYERWREARGGLAGADTQRAVRGLVDLYEAWGRAADAAMWRAKQQ